MEEAPQVKSAMQSLQNEFGPRQRELVAMQNDLKSARREAGQRSGTSWRKPIGSRPRKRLRDQQREFSRKGGEFQDDLSTRKNEEIGKVQRYLLEEMRTYAVAQGFDLVLGEGVYLRKPQLDITAQILEVLKSKAGSAPASAPKAAAPAKPPGTK